MKPTVSIVIPAYNSSGTIAETLASVVAQSYDDYEVIIVDDASNDNTLSVVRACMTCDNADRFQLIERDVNGGPAAARNNGIAMARGEWIAFLDGDDVWLEDRLKIQMDLALEHSDVDLWCGGALDVGDDRVLDITEKGVSAVTLDELAISNPVITSTVLVRKHVLDEVGGFDERFRGPEDYDLWIRIAAKYKMMKTEAMLAKYRYVPGSLSMDDRKFLAEVLLVLDKAFSAGGALHSLDMFKKWSEAEQYFSASWMAFNRGDKRTARRHLLSSWRLRPGRLMKEKNDRLFRLKLLFRYMFA